MGAFCGEKYASLVRSASGKSPASPCVGLLSDLPVLGDVDVWCNVGDWKDWQLGMESLQTRVANKLVVLLREAGKMGRSDVPDRIKTHYLSVADNSYNLAISTAPSDFAFPGSASVTESIFRAISTDELYACALEQIDLGFVELGLEAPATAAPSKTPDAGGTDWMRLLRNGGIALGSATFAYLLFKYYLTKRQQKAQAVAAAGPGPEWEPETVERNWSASAAQGWN